MPIPSGPAWAVAVGLIFTGLALLLKAGVPVIAAIRRNARNGGASQGGVESRMAGGEAATLLSEIRENRRQVGETHEIVTMLAKLGERSAALLEQVTSLVAKTDTRLEAMSENTQAMSRMLQLHTGLLDKSALQIDAIFTRTEGSQAAIKAILKKRRRRKI
jgi:hypothetical protein